MTTINVPQDPKVWNSKDVGGFFHDLQIRDFGLKD